MKPKTREEIAKEIEKLKAQDKQLINDKKIAYATGISKAIKEGHINPKTINDALDIVVTRKKDRALLGLEGGKPSGSDDTASQEVKNNQSKFR